MKELNLEGLEPIDVPQIPNAAQINRADFSEVKEIGEATTYLCNFNERGNVHGISYTIKKREISRNTVEDGVLLKMETTPLDARGRPVGTFSVLFLKDNKIYKEAIINSSLGICEICEVKQRKDGASIDHGRYVKYRNGKLIYYCTKKDNKLHGKEYNYDAASGVIKTKTYYRDGLKHGVRTVYDAHGKVESRTFFEEGKPIKTKNTKENNGIDADKVVRIMEKLFLEDLEDEGEYHYELKRRA